MISVSASEALDLLRLAVPVFATLVGKALYDISVQLGTKHGADVRVVWYLFFLAVTGTALAAWWGVATGAIASNGTFETKVTGGYVLEWLFAVLTDTRGEILFLIGLVVLALLPQYGSYFISALFGCADAPILVDTVMRLVFWSAVKFMVVAAGVQIVSASIGWSLHWIGFELEHVLGTAFYALVFLGFSFAAIFIYREGFDAIPTLAFWRRPVFDRVRRWFVDWFRRFDKWASRNNPAGPSDDWLEVVGFRKLHFRSWTVRRGRRGWSIEARQKKRKLRT